MTNPELPDFDRDLEPDRSDTDDDNDSELDTIVPEPLNPNVPTASSEPPNQPSDESENPSNSDSSNQSSEPSEESGQVTPEILQEIRNIISRNESGNLKCVECAAEIEEYLKQQNIRGRRIELDTPQPRTKYDGNIYDDSLPLGSDVIADNGHHEGVAVNINGEEIVFDNHHPDGVPYDQWKINLVFDSKIRFGVDFDESGRSF